ncbi:Epoxide hydrolase 4 [Halotydeus destructor]|nr:Epoxide hydrolase 4 [Halotydeus destructor]
MMKWIVPILSIFYGFLVILRLAFDVVRYGRQVFLVKRRNNTPQALLDSDFQHVFVKLNNSLKMHYVTSGDQSKATIVMLHGFPELWYSWRHQIKFFRSDYHVVVPDLRGYGETDKPKGVENYTIDVLVEDIKQLIETLGKDNVILMAHDWGGALAYVFAARYPEMVSKLIVMNTGHYKQFGEVFMSSLKQFFMSWYMIFFKLPFLPELYILRNDLRYLDDLFTDKNGDPLLLDEDMECYKYSMAKTGAVTAPINFYRARFLENKMAIPPRIKVPTLVIWGGEDKYLSQECGTGCAKYIDNFSYRLIEDGSHFIQFDKPDLVNQYASDFLSQ